TDAGLGPRAIALARNDKFAVIADSSENKIRSFEIGSDGVPELVDSVTTPNPFALATAWGDNIVASNLDTAQLAVFHIDRHGNMTEIGGPYATGIDPHVVAIGSRGLVAVGNAGSNDVWTFDIDRNGNMDFLASYPLGASPRTLAFSPDGHELFVGTRLIP